MKYPKLFEKGKIGNLEIKNRVVVTSMGTMIANSDYSVSDDYIAYVSERAKGGLGLFICEVTMIDEVNGHSAPKQIAATRLSHIPGWRRLADSVHKYGTKIFVQLWHPGRQTQSAMNPTNEVVSSGDKAGIIYPEKPRMLTKEEIKDLVQKFAFGAHIVKTAGIDGVELHAAHSYLLHQFISPWINNRTDEYGGSLENRMRIVKEIVDAIREKCGPDFPISVRISATEDIPNIPEGYDLQEGIRIAEHLDQVIGVDLINVSNGVAESSFKIQEPPTYPQGWKINNAREIKKHVKTPVIAVSQIRQPAYAEQLLEEGAVDFIGNSRGHLADPHWCNKAKAGEDLAIRPCVSCLYCFNEVMNMRETRCAVNPCMGRERDLTNLVKDGNGRTVAVIGGGPAGLEAARILAEREFKVVLFEKTDKLGGALQLANKPLHKERIDWLIDNMSYQVKKAGVEIRMNTEATMVELKALNPYAVFVATGCQPLDIPFPGVDKPHVYSVVDYLNGDVAFNGKNIAVIGGGTTGCEVAEKLSIEGNTVSVVEMREDVGLDMYPIPRRDFMVRMADLKIDIMKNCKLQEITDKGIICQDLENNKTIEKNFDAVIMSLGFKPENSMVEAVEKEFDNVIVLGDAIKVRKIADAIFEGYTRAYTLA